MRILITGGAGCLGSNLVEHWLRAGHRLLVIDNFATGKQEVVPPVPGLEVVEGSVADEALVRATFDRFRPEMVVHAAASYKNPDDWAEDIRTNVLGSAHVARAAKDCGAVRLVNFQTALCYGRPRTVPIPADHPTAPFTSYGITKTAGEQFMLQSGVPTVTLRISNVTGPRLAIGPIPTFYKRLKAGQGCFCSDSLRDFLDMADFLAFMDLSIRPGAPTGVFNVSSGEAHSIGEIFRIVAEHVGKPEATAPLQPIGMDDVAVVALDPADTMRAFGWKARIGFRETVRRQLEWYDRHGVTDVFSHLKVPDGSTA
jgi:UDP-glucose 4-epimerase